MSGMPPKMGKNIEQATGIPVNGDLKFEQVIVCVATHTAPLEGGAPGVRLVLGKEPEGVYKRQRYERIYEPHTTIEVAIADVIGALKGIQEALAAFKEPEEIFPGTLLLTVDMDCDASQQANRCLLRSVEFSFIPAPLKIHPQTTPPPPPPSTNKP